MDDAVSRASGLNGVLMGGMYGADVAELRRLGGAVADAATRLQEARHAVDGALSSVPWSGPDGDGFRTEWSDRQAVLLARCVDLLTDVATTVRTNADQQEGTSTDGVAGGRGPGGPGSGGGPGGGGGDRGGEDLPGNPDLGDYGTWVDVPPNIPLDDNAIDPNEINQQTLGDCWLLAALGAVASDDPQWIRDHMQLNPDGTWTVTMYKDGEPVEITVEPEVASQGAMDPNGDPSWVSIYEKAAAEYWGGEYEDLDGGYSSDAFEAITGAEASSSGDASLEDLQDRLQDGPVALGTEGEGGWWPFGDEVDDSRIVPDHAYVVDRVEERDGELMVHVVNPWGPGDHPQDDGSNKIGDMWLTQQEYDENFDTVYSVPSTR
ncbi:hypothetical protein IF650_02280 [Cellulosimicrobium terreum]|nr:hypothetical protein [Cellulosimicrobium terreum]